MMLLSWLRWKGWPWLKKNWRWVLFPVGLLSLIVAGMAASKGCALYSEPPVDLDDRTRETLRKLRQRELEHDKQIAELEWRHKERLQELSEEQQKELEQLQGKSIKEVVTWFDNL